MYSRIILGTVDEGEGRSIFLVAVVVLGWWRCELKCVKLTRLSSGPFLKVISYALQTVKISNVRRSTAKARVSGVVQVFVKKIDQDVMVGFKLVKSQNGAPLQNTGAPTATRNFIFRDMEEEYL